MVKVNVFEAKLIGEWCGEWKDWEEFHASADVQAVITKAVELLSRAGGKGGQKGGQKGQGKGAALVS